MDNTTGLIILILIILLQLKERELKFQRMWIAPVLIAYYTFTHVFNDFTLIETGLFVVLLALGGIVGAVRGSTTIIRIDKSNGKVYAKSSYIALGIWVVVFILRFIVTYIFKGSSQYALGLVTNGIFCLIAASACIKRVILYLKAKSLMHSKH
ncbi:CcdC protein domain-containing protein [Bacillus wiedmannii]|uniref:DUF1453 domain-containing protein n=1 Tax=Bacillus wiedmannii TaxID=1890302 RepID=A0A2A8BEQ2_9BACI|nr:CcdC protein domain-containing protein [Bacillus wiedmannii]PEM43226.1 DUF1453 domain-containing protein [Bacillus wiedmannii]